MKYFVLNANWKFHRYKETYFNEVALIDNHINKQTEIENIPQMVSAMGIISITMTDIKLDFSNF